MSKLFGGVFFFLAMFYLATIFITGDPLTRINRTCEPIHWVGTATTSVSNLAGGKFTPRIQAFFDARFKDCRYMVWQQFYEKSTASVSAD